MNSKIIFATNFGYELFDSYEQMIDSDKYTDHNSIYFNMNEIEKLHNDDFSAFLSAFPANCQGARKIIEGYIKN